MMGFGASALILGNAADTLFKSSLGWRFTYVILGVAICAVLFLTGILLRKPDAQTVLPQPKAAKAAGGETFQRRDYTSRQMLCRPSFWMAFVCIAFLAAVGSSVISFAKDLALAVDAPEALAVALVGVLSVCNGLGRILTGALFDAIGRRKTMLLANVLAMGAAAVILLAVSIGSLPLCVAGLCLSGLSYGACSTITAAFTSAFFGMKYFSTNMAFMTFNVMGGSLIATMSNKVLEITGGYTATFIMLLALTFAALILNIFIRKP
jgi:OFA family oxalate/formate antiporter-like MFS transporter